MHKFWGQVLLFLHGINKYLLFFSSIAHLPIPDFILKLYTFNILLFELFLQTGSRSMQEQQKVENVWVNRNSSAENYGLSTVTMYRKDVWKVHYKNSAFHFDQI
jgi:hypothetical protein